MERVYRCYSGTFVSWSERFARVPLANALPRDWDSTGWFVGTGLDSPASRPQPTGSSICAILGPCVEGNRRPWGSIVNRVYDGFE